MTALRRSPLLLLATLTLAVLLPPALAKADVPARVVAVHDGDTLTVLADRTRVRVRLTDIDAPELGQPFGRRAKTALSDLCFGKLAEMETRGRDRYGRTLARVRCGGQDANAEQVRQGYAWVYIRYAPVDSPLYALELEAKNARRGLWGIRQPIPPWEWRRGRSARSFGASNRVY